MKQGSMSNIRTREIAETLSKMSDKLLRDYRAAAKKYNDLPADARESAQGRHVHTRLVNLKLDAQTLRNLAQSHGRP